VLRSERLRALLCGKPSVLILGGRLMQREIRRQRVDLNDLMEQLRLCGVMHIEDVAAAVLEASGQLSVFPKGTKRTVTPGDLSFAPPDDEVPFTLILDGKVNRGNLKKAELTPEALEKMLHAQHIASPKEVFLATIDPQKQLRLQRKEKI